MTGSALAARPRFLAAMRVTVILQAVALLVQAATAGTLLASPDGRALHGVTALAVVATAAAQLLVAVLVWRPGGGSPRFIAGSAFMLVLSLAAAALGDLHAPELHVPLGTLLFGGSVVLVVRAWSGRRA
ncbi:hypothetical protein GCM10009850_115550 [Nonomuraea monospora]|uniref:Integral membrane protein n=1 Tax=Nonomuraea monospora TaxID=568818 RepID=A0ABP5PWF8_9ACTN